ncbi:ADP-ribosylglycohydrolase family protein [Lacticigenium naphthae]|uniref:ADP-ribosylglycohydrolase family protein n=1 Tax=Lacticigenium naphthae TaxID=515351 RepID=UPI00041270EC|nr:ADP-ribosylglycohydrolase family protein [Lacticigenium naphthae]
MIGVIIGDIVGSRFEYTNYRKKEFELVTPECFFTDDTVMIFAIAKAIMETEEMLKLSICKIDVNDDYLEHIESKVVEWMQIPGRSYPDTGYGEFFGQWIFSNKPEPYNSFGNGEAMHISLIGDCARSLVEGIEFSRTVTQITHNHDEG